MLMTILRCVKCGDTVWSERRHDMSWCGCGAIAIDGGDDYIKITGDAADMLITEVNVDRTNKEDVMNALRLAKWRPFNG